MKNYIVLPIVYPISYLSLNLLLMNLAIIIMQNGECSTIFHFVIYFVQTIKEWWKNTRKIKRNRERKINNFPPWKLIFTLRQPYTSFRDIAFWLGFFYEKTLLTAIKTPLTCSSLRPHFSARRFIPLRSRGKVRGNKSFGFTSLNRDVVQNSASLHFA